MYEIFDHTADVGLRVRADDLKQLFEEAGRALFSVIVANLDAVRYVRQVQFNVSGRRRDDLLMDWLAELVYRFDTERLVLSRFDVELSDTGLSATGFGEPLDPERHELDAEVKAVTYHGFKLVREGEGWLAEVILDL